MGLLRLTYEQDDEANQSGVLHVTVQARGFHAACSPYVAASAVASFANGLQQYPLRADGTWFDALEFRLIVRPLGSLGHLLVDAEVEETAGPSSLTQKARIQLESDYGAVGELAKALAMMARRGSGDASLRTND